MLMRLLLCIALVGPAAFAGWPRYVGVLDSDHTDTPPPHRLEYFQVDPCLRPRSDFLVRAFECNPSPSELKRELRAATRTKLVEVGKTAKFTIYDLWYLTPPTDRSGIPTDFNMRSVLVKSGPDEYHEIDVRTPYESILPPSMTIDTFNGGPLLIVESNEGGIHHVIVDTLYMFDRTGVVKPNFLAVEQAIQKLMPPGLSILTETNDYASPACEVTLFRPDRNEPSCCQTAEGKITVYYRFVGSRAAVTGSKYEPPSQ
jgi:hypothetical protein